VTLVSSAVCSWKTLSANIKRRRSRYLPFARRVTAVCCVLSDDGVVVACGRVQRMAEEDDPEILAALEEDDKNPESVYMRRIDAVCACPRLCSVRFLHPPKRALTSFYCVAAGCHRACSTCSRSRSWWRSSRPPEMPRFCVCPLPPPSLCLRSLVAHVRLVYNR
jgi:hypothetical protein